jgi:hypothetical protein
VSKVTNKSQIISMKLDIGLTSTLDNPGAELKELLPNLLQYFGEALKGRKSGMLGKIETIALQVKTVDSEGKELVIQTPPTNFRIAKTAYTNKYMNKIQLIEDPVTGKKAFQVTEKTRKLLANDKANDKKADQ